MKLNSWMNRIGNVRKIKNSRKSLEYQLLRVHSEVSEMADELRAGADLHEIRYERDKFGIEKPEGFIAEWGDAVSQLLHIADLVGFDANAALELSVGYHERKQQRKPSKDKKGKK